MKRRSELIATNNFSLSLFDDSRFTTILFLTSGIDEISAQFKVIKMEDLGPMTSVDDGAATASPANSSRVKLARNSSNVTLIHVMKSQPMKRRRSDKEIRQRAEASDLEIVTVTPVSGFNY